MVPCTRGISLPAACEKNSEDKYHAADQSNPDFHSVDPILISMGSRQKEKREKKANDGTYHGDDIPTRSTELDLRNPAVLVRVVVIRSD